MSNLTFYNIKKSLVLSLVDYLTAQLYYKGKTDSKKKEKYL